MKARVKRVGYIIDKIIADENMEEAFCKVLRGTKRKESEEGKQLLAEKNKVLENLKKEISEGTFRINHYWEKTVFEGGKWRVIQITSMERRIGVFAIMNIVDEYLRKRFIRTTAASIKGRGTHDLAEYIRDDMRKDPEGMRYCYMFDIYHFYDSIMPDFVMYCLRRVFKDEPLLNIMDGLLHMIPNGISKGLRSSQGLSNLLLSVYLDHYLKDRYGVRYYYRYCDDGRIYHHSKKVLWEIRNMIFENLNDIELRIKQNERVFPNRLGVDFLGYVTYTPTYVRMRKRVKQSFARRLARVKSRRRRRELIASFYGIAKHANCRRLFQKLTGKSMSEYIRWKDTGLKPKHKDGKKHFEGNTTYLIDLQNEEILINDFETNVLTNEQKTEYKKLVAMAEKTLKESVENNTPLPQGFVRPADIVKPEGRYVISAIRYPGTDRAEQIKIWTGDHDNQATLEQIKDEGLLGKVLVTVKSVRCKNYMRYIIC